MRDRALEAFRLLLTITGFVLLVVFGSRAAHEASSMKAAGATDGRRTIATTLGIRLLLGLHNPHAIPPVISSHPDSGATATASEHASRATPAKEAEMSHSPKRPSSATPTTALPTKPRVLGTQAVQSVVDEVTPDNDRPVKVLDVPKTIVNDTLGKDATDNLAPITNNLPIIHHLLL